MQPTRQQGHPAAGIAIAEVLIGAVVLLVGLSGIFLSTIECSRMRRTDEETNLAVQACRAKLEAIRALPFLDVAAQNGQSFAVDGNADGKPDLRAVPGDPDGQPGLVTVTSERTSGPHVLHRVNVSLTWSGNGGRRSLWLETLVGNRVGQ